jgi:hypothetical protein
VRAVASEERRQRERDRGDAHGGMVA